MIKNSTGLMLSSLRRTLLSSHYQLIYGPSISLIIFYARPRFLKSLGNIGFLVQLYDLFRIFRKIGKILGLLGF